MVCAHGRCVCLSCVCGVCLWCVFVVCVVCVFVICFISILFSFVILLYLLFYCLLLHIPPASWTPDQLQAVIEKVCTVQVYFMRGSKPEAGQAVGKFLEVWGAFLLAQT
jgi:hypothetical protein